MAQQTIEQWVWYYSNIGFSVIPLGKNAGFWGNPENELKRPSLKSWEKYHTTRPTREELEQWLKDGLFVNIGVVCGHVSNDLVVIDIDDAKIPIDIGLNLKEVSESGFWVVKTGKGFHIYCRHHDNPGGIKRPLKYKIEYRANSGYVVAPPSIHPETKKEYEFMGINSFNDLKEIKMIDAASLFANLKKDIGKIRNIKSKESVFNADNKKRKVTLIDDFPECVKKALVTKIKHPHRYFTTYGIVSSCVFRGFTKEQTMKLVKDFNKKMCEPPHDEEIVVQAVEGAYGEKPHLYGCEFWMDDAEMCPLEDISECPFGYKRLRKELIKKYHVFSFKEIKKDNGEKYLIPDKVNEPRLAELILNEFDLHFVTMRDNREILFYNDGHFHQNGETKISAISEEFMEELCNEHAKTEVIGYIRDKNYDDRKNFVANQYLINLKNGVFYLKDGSFLSHSPDFKFLNTVPVSYKEGTDCPKIKKFLSEVCYEEDIPTIQEFVGYCLYRKYPIHKACMLIGGGKNGKSTFLRLLTKLIGEENISHREIQQLTNDKFSIGDLYGKLANICSDISANALKSTGLFKSVTGEDAVYADRKFRGPFQFTNYAKFIFSANALPKTPDKSYAFYRRWILINFPNTFDDKSCNPNIIEEITTDEEMSGFLNWGIDGLKRLLQNKDFSYGKSVEDVAEQYELLSEPLKAFVNEFIVEKIGSGISKAALYEKYVNWCKQQQLAIIPRNIFTSRLSEYRPGVRTGFIGGKIDREPAYRDIDWKISEKPNENEKEQKTLHYCEKDYFDGQLTENDENDEGMGGSENEPTDRY